MPKAGWTIEKTVTGYKAEYDLHGKKVAEGVTELSWSGGSVADDEYDEFVFRAYITDAFKPGLTIAFRVVLECVEGATTRWIGFPAVGKVADDYEHPAPVLTVVDK